MTSAELSCTAVNDDLVKTCKEDRKLSGSLESLRGSIQLGLKSLPSALIQDLEQLLTVLLDSKVDIGPLYGEIFDLQERITNLRTWADNTGRLLHEERLLRRAEVQQLRRDIRNLEIRVEDTEQSLVFACTALRGTGKQLAMRQVLQALNEKLLACIQRKLGMDSGDFWRKYALRNIGKIQGQPLEHAWQELQKEYSISGQPDIYWRLLKGCKQPLDTFVHVGRFDRLSYEELKSEADKFYVGTKAKHKATFLDALELSKRISDSTKTSMYDID